MLQFGGHKYAAGLTLAPDNYQAFKDRFEEVVKNSIAPECCHPELLIDQELELEDIDAKFYRILKQFAPFGPANNSPVFASEVSRVSQQARQVGADKSHLKVSIDQGQSRRIDGIGFGLGDKMELVNSGLGFRTAYSLDENHWNGKTSIQLKIRDIKPVEDPGKS